MHEPFGIYLHIPFCLRRCPFCDFNVVPGRKWDEKRFIDAITRELTTALAREERRHAPVATVYFGGGTPSLLEASSIGSILDTIRDFTPLQPDAEVSLEANPEGLTERHLSSLRESGVNRLSIGVESYDARFLERLGRLATSGDVATAIPKARRAGFDNVSIDLMYALPGQTPDDWQDALDRGVADRPDHISAYSLTFEPGTNFDRLRREGKLMPASEGLELEMLMTTRERLGSAGYHPYEVSSFARDGRRSRHNDAYWTGKPWLGVGPGAHSHQPDGPRTKRWWNETDLASWSGHVLDSGSAVAGSETLDGKRAAGEAILTALRRTDGLDEQEFEKRFGARPFDFFPEATEQEAAGRLERVDGSLRLTNEAWAIADSVLATFV